MPSYKYDELDRVAQFVEGLTDLSRSTGVALNISTGGLVIGGRVLGYIDVVDDEYTFDTTGITS